MGYVERELVEGRERRREGGRERGREGRRDGGREGEREGRREGGPYTNCHKVMLCAVPLQRCQWRQSA